MRPLLFLLVVLFWPLSALAQDQSETERDRGFLTGLIAFNIGVELGQLVVITAALILVGLPFGTRPWYRARIAVPASIVIGLVAWSGLTAATGLARGYAQIFAARVGVGIGEAVGSGPIQSRSNTSKQAVRGARLALMKGRPDHQAAG